MCKNGLRLSPKKYQLFKTNLIYMGNEFGINRRTMTITPLRSRTEAIKKKPTPRSQELLWCSKLLVIILSRFTEIIKTNS